MAELKAALFDLDGVLVDSHSFHYQSWQRIADELGLHFNEKLGDTYRGMERSECLRFLFEEFNNRPVPDDDTVHQLTERKNKYYHEILSKATSDDLVLPGAVELLEALRAEGVINVVASGSKNAKTVIDIAGIGGYLDAVIDRFDVEVTKPDPSIFRVALERVNTPAENAVGVEDALLGIEALRGASVKAIGVGHYVDEADLLVDSVKDLTVDMMRELLAGMV